MPDMDTLMVLDMPTTDKLYLTPTSKWTAKHTNILVSLVSDHISVLDSLTVMRSPFQSWVALAISSPTFFGERPRGPILGASVAVAPTSPPTALKHTTLTSVGSNLGGILSFSLRCLVTHAN